MWNLPDIHLKIFGEVSAGSKVHHLFGVALQLPMNKAEDTGKYLQMHNICHFRASFTFLYAIIEHCSENIPISDKQNEAWLIQYIKW